MFALMSGDVQALSSQFNVAASREGQGWRLRLTPKSAMLAKAFESLTLQGNRYVRQVEIVEANKDRTQIQRKLGLRLGRSIDLSHLVKRLGFKDAVGLKVAVAVVLGQRFIKSKKATTSNWANPTLTPQQLQYAANDAHASLLV